MDVFLQNVLGILPILGVFAFDTSPSISQVAASTPLFCKSKRANAQGFDTPQGFVVTKNSYAAVESAPSLADHFPNIIKQRDDLVQKGVLVVDGDKYRFTQDYTFSSPSLAAAIVLARPSNGRTAWEDKNGTSLKQLQEQQAKAED
ncbi:MAG: DUF4357 domain-containing protein [Pirellulaceae bacterium]